MAKLKVLEHPLVQSYLTVLRNKSTGKQEFSVALDKISYLMAADIYSNLATEPENIETPLKR